MLSKKWLEYNNAQILISEKNIEFEKKIQKMKDKQKNYESHSLIGYFTISHYDLCYSCTGKSPGDKGYGITATGAVAKPHRTIAVDPNVIPFGTNVIINGRTYIAEDTGSAIKGNRIDICVSSHNDGLKQGILYNIPVYIVKS